ncbi:10266_t:CDS:2 [Entrophospora sp. SA101]|nr:10266_t:CDS:2 [Entrophospora sp. SA101]
MNEYYYNNLDIDIGDGVEDDESFYDDGRKRKKAGLVIGFDPLEKISQKGMNSHRYGNTVVYAAIKFAIEETTKHIDFDPLPSKDIE